MTRFEFLTVGSALHDAAHLERVTTWISPMLEAAGGAQTSDPQGSENLALVVLTGGTEHAILSALGSRDEREPVLLVTHPGENSLPAALEALARLHQQGRPGRIAHLTGPHDRAGATRLVEAVTDLEVAATLRRTRLGVLGDPSEWLVASVPSGDDVARSWGPTLVPVPFAEVLETYRRAPGKAGAALSRSVQGGATAVLEPTIAAIDDAALVEPVLREIVERRSLDAITVRCFDLVTALGTTGCLALSALNDTGIVAGCEGDVPSALAMRWTSLLLDQIPWMANPAHVDAASGRVLLAHCTVPRALAGDYRLRSHFESGLGVSVAGTLPLGPVTLVRIGGRHLRSLWIAEGTSVPHEPLEGVCRTQLAVDIAASDATTLLDRPLGNHIVVVTGHHAARLRRFADGLHPPPAD
ncbi:MAG TPA: hypothetical protein VHN98_00185 [Acidimicrobiales bacterium]|nr:hypothetical protein [Acidimicrobiales bacterium]